MDLQNLLAELTDWERDDSDAVWYGGWELLPQQKLAGFRSIAGTRASN